MATDTDKLLQQGINAHYLNELEQAEILYKKILKIEPLHPDANHNLGVLLYSVGNKKKAMTYFSMALSANDTAAQFWVSYINALIATGETDIAKIMIADSKRKVIIDNVFIDFLDKINSLSDFVDDVQISGDPSKQQLKSLMNLFEKGKFKETLKFAKAYQRIFPQSAILCNLVGVTHKRIGNYKSALHSFEAALKINPNLAEVHNNVGNLYRDKQQHRDALGAYKKAVSVNNKFADAFNNLGNAFYTLGEFTNAEEAYKRAIDINPTFVAAYNNLGSALRELRSYSRSISFFQKALQLDPDYKFAKQNLLVLLEAYSPKGDQRDLICRLDGSVKRCQHQVTLAETNHELADKISRTLLLIQNHAPNLRGESLQLFCRSTVDLDCDRHFKVFNAKKIIPKSCFSCFKVQIEVENVLDLVRLAQLFHVTNFEDNIFTKCFIEERSFVSGSYKGIVYCNSVESAENTKNMLNFQLTKLDKNIEVRVKRGCSEFPLVYPEYGNIEPDEGNFMTYPEEWAEIERDIGEVAKSAGELEQIPSLKSFALNNYLTIHRWIDYAKGIADPTAHLFEGVPVNYETTFELGRSRLKSL